MRISRTAVIAGLVVAVILPSAVQVSDHAENQVLGTFSQGGGLNFLHSTDLTVLKSGGAFVTSRDLDPSTHLVDTETWRFTLSRSRLEQLKFAFSQTHFRSLRPRYIGECYDCGYYVITYAGRTVRCDRLSIEREPAPLGILAPKRLAPVLRLLSNLAGTRPSR